MKTANISACGKYRYSLTREWSDGHRLGYVMLNPSTADADVDDPTIRKCVGFAKQFGFGGIEVVNLFALRSTDPHGLLSAEDPVGPDNDKAIVDALSRCQTVVAAWGAWGGRDVATARVVAVRGLAKASGRTLQCLRATKDGHPGHPLYIPYSATLSPLPKRK